MAAVNWYKNRPKERDKVVKAICKEYAKNEHTLESICKANGITRRGFQNWRDKYPKYKRWYNKSLSTRRANYDYDLVQLAKTNLQKSIGGYQVKEYKVEGRKTINDWETLETANFQGEIKVTETIKTILSNPTLIMYALNNKAPDEFRRVDSKATEDDVPVERSILKIGEIEIPI